MPAVGWRAISLMIAAIAARPRIRKMTKKNQVEYMLGGKGQMHVPPPMADRTLENAAAHNSKAAIHRYLSHGNPGPRVAGRQRLCDDAAIDCSPRRSIGRRLHCGLPLARARGVSLG